MYPRPSLKKAKMSIIDSKSPSPKLSNPFMSAKKFEFPFNPKELKYKRGTPDFEQSDKRPNGSAYTRLKSEGKERHRFLYRGPDPCSRPPSSCR